MARVTHHLLADGSWAATSGKRRAAIGQRRAASGDESRVRDEGGLRASEANGRLALGSSPLFVLVQGLARRQHDAATTPQVGIIALHQNPEQQTPAKLAKDSVDHPAPTPVAPEAFKPGSTQCVRVLARRQRFAHIEDLVRQVAAAKAGACGLCAQLADADAASTITLHDARRATEAGRREAECRLRATCAHRDGAHERGRSRRSRMSSPH
jgi:hypothetical protein